MARIDYNLTEDVVDDTQKVVTSTWTNNVNNLIVDNSFTSSIQADFVAATSSGAHYIEVYNNTGLSASQFSVAYGHRAGSGSLDFTNDTNAIGNSPSKNIYNQYRQLVFGDETKHFAFPGDGDTNAFTPNDIYVINVNRSRYKNNLKPGSLNLHLGNYQAGTFTGVHLTDDSVTTTGSAVITNAGRQFNIVSGSNGVRSGSTNIQNSIGSGSYGLYYPDSGFIVLNPVAIGHILTASNDVGDASTCFIPERGGNTHSIDGTNSVRILNAISGGGKFIVDSEEKISSKYYFTRIKNSQHNFTTNPSFIDSTGNLRYSTMENNPKVYITTVGLYNDTNDLVAVAKLSQPIAKDFSKEALIRVKLDY